MAKLIKNFQNNPNINTAVAVLKYARKHPMTAVMFGEDMKRVELFYIETVGK